MMTDTKKQHTNATADNPQVSISLTQTLIQALHRCDVTHTDQLLTQCGIQPSLLKDPENRIPFENQAALWQAAIDATDESFPLAFAQQSQVASFSVVGYIALNCETLGEAMEAAEHYQQAAGQGGHLKAQTQNLEPSQTSDVLIISYTPINPEHSSTPLRSCAMLTANLNIGRSLIGTDYTPLTVDLSMSEPKDKKITHAFETFFGSPVRFNQPQNQMVFNHQLQHQPLPHASREILNLMKQRAQKVLDHIEPSRTVADEVTNLLSATLIGQEPDKASIAAHLNMSQRTLQRKLTNEGTSYQETLDKLRHKLALEYLSQPELNATDIAYLLGFTEPSAFYRAFKKWQGVPPGSYRENLNL